MPAAVKFDLTGASMGTTWQVQMYAATTLNVAEIQAGIQARLNVIDRQMSTWDAQSDLCRFNQAEAHSWHTLAPELATVLDSALFHARQSGGALDPAMGTLVNLWGFGPAPKRSSPPADADILAAHAASHYKRLDYQRLERKLYQPGGLMLDLCAIAKGYAVDLVAEYLDSLHCPSYMVEVGGELRGLGVKADGMPWWVHFAQLDGASTSENLLALHGVAVATSGNSLQYFEHQGLRYAHTLDPRTGWPVQNHLAAVSVIHPQCMQADAMATVLLVLGVQKGMEYAQQNHVAALFVECSDAGMREYLSPALAVMLDD